MIYKKDQFFTFFNKALQERTLFKEIENLDKITHYFFLLYHENLKKNLTGYKEVDDFIDFHLVDVVRILKIISPKRDSIVFDVGTGAGIPGLIMGLIQNDLKINLIEKNKKKSTFLELAINECDIKNISVIKERAEDAAHDFRYREKGDIVIARALGPLSLSLELTAGFVRVGGEIYLPRGEREIIDEKKIYEILGCELADIVEYTLPRREKAFMIEIYKKNHPILEKYPRKPGHIKKRPL